MWIKVGIHTVLSPANLSYAILWVNVKGVLVWSLDIRILLRRTRASSKQHVTPTSMNIIHFSFLTGLDSVRNIE